LEALQPLRPAVRIVAWYTGAAKDAFGEWFGLVDDWRNQPAGALGVRLAAAFDGNNASPTGNIASRRKTIAIGTDCLDLDVSLVSAGFDLLEQHDVVLGPTPDGGYYLVGAAGPVSGLFQNVRWSSPHTRADQVEQCQRLGLSVGMLPPRSDIDTWEDWCEYQKTHTQTSGPAGSD
jgi:glycosyltransferase A (GT-A) superfamily protein (DUF2064 family)